MPDISVPWGDDELRASLPDAWSVQQVASPSLRPARDDWPERLAMALAQTGSDRPLSRLLAENRDGRVAIIVEDLTRHSPLAEILEVVMREIHHARVPDENVRIVFATGMHPAITREQAREKIGDFADSLSWRCNPWRDPSAYVPLGRVGRVDVSVDRGVVEADLRIVVSSVSPHLQAGFGGGCKMLLPGCAALETIRGLHRLGIGRSARQLVGTIGEENPMRSMIDAGGRLVDSAGGKTFALQYVLDENDLPTHVAAGDPDSTQRMLAKQCAVSSGVVTGEQADVVITNAHPRDYDLWQSFKCIPNTLWAARPNGVIICLARCEAGMEGMEVPRWRIKPSWVRRLVRLLGPNALASLLVRLAPHLAGDAAFFIRMALQTVHRNTILMVSPTLYDGGAFFPGLPIFREVEDAVHAAQAVLGAGPQRVIVFPSGGITFPVVRNR